VADWVKEDPRRLAEWKASPVAVLRRGPAAPVADALERAGVTLLPMGDPEYAAACGDVFDRLTDAGGHQLVLRAHEGLDTAFDIAGKRLVGDGGWVWSRSRSAGDIAPLEAGTVATWAAHRPVPPPAPKPAWSFG
jgi:hypothetical protein